MSQCPVDSFPSPAPAERPRPEPVRRRLVPSAQAAGQAAGERRERDAAGLPVEIGFLTRSGVPPEMLRYAAALARRQGVSADAALLDEGLLDAEFFYRALAERLGVDFLDGDFALTSVSAAGAAAGAQRGYARLADDPRGLTWLFAPRGEAIGRLMSASRAARGRALFAVTTPARFVAAARRASAADLARAAAHSAERVDRDLCARAPHNRRALAATTGGGALLLAALFGPFEAPSLAAALLLTAAFLASVFLRLFACAASYEKRDRAHWLADAALPDYTVVVALYKEAAVARQLARALDRLDYPRAKLDIKFVVECDDDETLDALRRSAPRAPHEFVVVPPGAPRTKPRALNVAAPFARGSLIAVYDAEDLPDPRQLRKAAGLFSRLPSRVACLQASLVIDNGGLNWMTALFALDYAALFDVYNRGLAAMGLPLFLGGTSNHFRLDALQAVGFWDAYNVTEDADLGLRLARAGFDVETFASQTFEEAPAAFPALVKQRTRWIKGWMQTALAHCRDPRRLVAELGARRAAAVVAMFAGGFVGPLLGPLLTGFFLWQAVCGPLLAPQTPLEIARSTLWCFLALAGAAALVWPMLVGAGRRWLWTYCRALPFLPLWLFMVSFAAWRALIELWRRPHHWEKTAHGLTRRGGAATVLRALREQPVLE